MAHFEAADLEHTEGSGMPNGATFSVRMLLVAPVTHFRMKQVV